MKFLKSLIPLGICKSPPSGTQTSIKKVPFPSPEGFRKAISIHPPHSDPMNFQCALNVNSSPNYMIDLYHNYDIKSQKKSDVKCQFIPIVS